MLTSKFDSLSVTRDIKRLTSIPTRFMSENQTEANVAWNATGPGHGAVMVDPQWAATHNLPPSHTHPRDSSEAICIIKAYHAIHCLVSR